MIIKRYQVGLFVCFFVFLNVVIEKVVYVTNPLQKGEQWQRRLLAWRLGPTYISEVGHHLITPPTPTYGRGEGSLPNSFVGEFILFIKTHFYRRALTSHFIYISHAVLWFSDMGSHGIFWRSTRHSCPISNCWTRSNWKFLGIWRHGLKFGTLSYTDYHSLKLTIFGTQQQFKFACGVRLSIN